jgi:hypothetical protein
MRRLTLLTLLVVGCRSQSSSEEPKPVQIRRDIEVGPGPWDQPGERSSKTIHQREGNTVVGTTFLGGALVVDKINAQEGQDVLGVDIRLRNTKPEAISGVYLIEFRTKTQDIIIGHKHGWEPFMVEGHGLVSVTNSALIAGAEGFRLKIHPQGADVNKPLGEADPKPK